MNLMRLLKFDTWSIRYKMLAGLALAIGLPLFLFFIMGSRTTPAVLLTHYESSLDFAVRSEAREIEANLNSVLAQIATISQSTEVSSQAVLFARMAAYEQIPISPVLRNSTIDILGASLEGHPAIRAARLLSSDGALLISVGETREFPGLTDNDQQQHPAYEQIMAVEFSQEAPLLLAPYIDPESENLLLEAATLVVSQDTLLGFMVYTLDTEALLVNPLTANMAETGSIQYSYILDADRRLLTPLKGLQPLERRVTLYGGGEPPAAGSVEPYIQNWDGTPVEVLGRHAVIERTGWSVVTEVIVEDVTGPISRTMVLRQLPLAALSTLLGVILILIINNQLIEPLARLTSIAEQFASGNLEAEVRFSRRPDEVGQLQRALSTMTDNLRQTISILEERVQARTRDLETTSTIAREAARQEDTNALLNHTVNLIVQNFPAIYHAQVFLVDPQNAYANLVASTGEAGRQLLAAGHRLAVGSVSVIGRVTELGETVIARDTATSSVHRRNEFLQDTQAEMALPLIYGDRVLGALDVQSKLAHAFTPEDQQVFNTLATELAIIINNAQQLATMQTQLTELETQSRVLSRTDWNQLLSANRRRGYLEARAGANDAAQAGSWSEWQQQAAAQKEVVASPPQPDDTVFLAVPVLSREDEVLGVIEWRVHRSRITDQSMRMAEQLARRLSNSMETVRLLERSQLLAERERLVNEISGKLTTEPSVAYILETAVNELSGILQTSRVNIQLKPSAAVPASGSSENK